MNAKDQIHDLLFNKVKYTNLDFTKIELASRDKVIEATEFLLQLLELPADIKIRFTNSKDLQTGSCTRILNKQTGAMRFNVKLPKQRGDNDSFMLFTLVHELVHVLQYWTGRLVMETDRADKDDTIWNGQFYSGDFIRGLEKQNGYFSTEWEKEANNYGMRYFWLLLAFKKWTVTTSFLMEYSKNKKHYNLDKSSVAALMHMNDNFHRGLPKKAAA